MEFLKGVHVIESYATTAVVFDNRLILVDTSAEASAKTILAYLDRVHVKPRDLATIFITHTHPDHVGGLAAIKTDSPAKVVASKIEADFVSKKRIYDGPPGASSQRHPGTPVDVVLEDGQVYDGLKTIYTPGHTRGSISLLDESRSLLFVGDAANNERGLRPMDDQYNVDPKQHRQSIKKLAGFEFGSAIFGHGTPIKGGASKQFQDLAKRL
jgi:glyoxylase-like metal-dependent hydrolase (beta-lactamase superfamily II)